MNESTEQTTHPRREQGRETARSWAALGQALLAVIAAVVVGLMLSAVALAGARLVPADPGCVTTDNAGCVSADGRLSGETGPGVETR